MTQTTPIRNLTDIQLRKEQLRTTIDQSGEKVATLWHDLTTVKPSADKGEMVTKKKPKRLNLAATLSCPLNGRQVAVWTTEPCIQVYTANWARYEQTAKGGEHLSFRCGCALETQHAPDSPNQPRWPSVFVQPGAVYSSTTEFRFSAK